VLEIKGMTKLLGAQPELAESVALSRPILASLNHLQIELLSRRRRGESGEHIELLPIWCVCRSGYFCLDAFL
jgi:phosphoenolpyruvate carboxylase